MRLAPDAKPSDANNVVVGLDVWEGVHRPALVAADQPFAQRNMQVLYRGRERRTPNQRLLRKPFRQRFRRRDRRAPLGHDPTRSRRCPARRNRSCRTRHLHRGGQDQIQRNLLRRGSPSYRKPGGGQKSLLQLRIRRGRIAVMTWTLKASISLELEAWEF